MKPELRVIAGRPVSIGRTREAEVANARIEEARKRFGGPFAYEEGTTWKPHVVPLLTEWMQSRGGQSRT